MRSRSWRISVLRRLSSSSGWPNRTICSSLCCLVSRFDSRRISSSVPIGMLCDSSTNTTTCLCSACLESRYSLSACITSRRPASRGSVSCSSKAMACRISSGETLGIRQVDRLHARRQARLQDPAQHGLAAAHLAGDLDDPLAVRDRVGQRLQHRAAVAALEKEVGVRSDPKRRLLEAEEGVVHRAVGQLFCVSATGA